MTTRTDIGRCTAVAGALLVGAALLGAPVAAQTPAGGSGLRWEAWLGCWQPVAQRSPGATGTATERVMCVVPTERTAVAELVTVDSGRIVQRDHVAATGERESTAEGGCAGWRSAEWSADGRRLYLRSESACTGGLERRSDGLFAMLPGGQWVDVRGVTAGEGTGVRTVRYERAAVPPALRDELAPVLEARRVAVTAARTAAAAPIGDADVVDAVRHLDARVVEAWLIERHESFALDGKRLVKLADAGVPGRVIDVMVALSYPEEFTVAATSPDRAGTEVVERGRAEESYTDQATGRTIPVYLDPYAYSPFGWDYYYSPFGYYYSPFGYSPYAYGWYGGAGPVIIIQQPGAGNGGERTQHGKVVNGRGYSRGERGSAADASARSGSVTRRSRSGTTTGAASGSRGGSSSSTRSAPVRTAKPRPRP